MAGQVPWGPSPLGAAWEERQGRLAALKGEG